MSTRETPVAYHAWKNGQWATCMSSNYVDTTDHQFMLSLHLRLCLSRDEFYSTSFRTAAAPSVKNNTMSLNVSFQKCGQTRDIFASRYCRPFRMALGLGLGSLDNVADEYVAKRARGVQFFKAMGLIRPGALTLMPEYVLPDYFSWTTKFYFKSDGERDKLS